MPSCTSTTKATPGTTTTDLAKTAHDLGSDPKPVARGDMSGARHLTWPEATRLGV
jgi:hypothetical protein